LSKSTSKKRTAVFLVLAVAVLLMVLLYINGKTAQKSSFLMEGRYKLSITGEISAVTNNSSMIYCVRDMLAEAQEENLRVKNIDGKVAWSQKLPGKIIKLADAGGNLIAIDSENNIYYYSLQGKLLWTHKTPYAAVDIFTEDNGSLMVEYKGITGSHAEVFTKEGSKAGSISIENAHILSFSAGPESFSVSVLDTSAEAIKTKIITYDYKGDILWAQNFDNKIIAKVKYNSNRLIALGENGLSAYKNDGSLQSQSRLEGNITNAAISGNMAALVLNDKGKYYAVCFDANIRELSRVEIRTEPLGLFPMKSSYIVYYGDELMVLTAKGELTAKYKSNADISSTYMTSEDKIYIVSNRVLQQLEFAKQ
jgi:hypothetical protein